MLLASVRKHPNVFAVLFGAGLTLVMLGCAEALAGMLLRRAAPYGQSSWQYHYEPTPLFVPDQRLGSVAPPEATVRWTRTRGNVQAYEVTVHTDAQARRVSPVPDPESRTEAALFFGCSFTFGEGVNDDQTLPVRFAAHAEKFLPYNYGLMGYGPQHAFLQLDRPDIFVDIARPVTLVVYTFIPQHLDRLIGRMRILTTWGEHLPCLVERGDRIEWLGNFAEAGLLRHRGYQLAGHSRLLKLFRIDLPPRLAPRHYVFAADVLEATAAKAKARFPQAHFLVLLYPMDYPREDFADMLHERDVSCFDPGDTFPANEAQSPAYQLPDFHPNAAAHERLGAALAAFVEESGPR